MQEETKGQASSDVWLHSGCVSKRRGCSCASGQLPADVGWRAMLPDVHTISGTVLCVAPASAGQHGIPQTACALCLRLPASMPGSAREEGRGSAQAQDWWRTRCLGGGDCGSASSLPRRQQLTGKWTSPSSCTFWLACRRHVRSASERCLLTTQAHAAQPPGTAMV